MVIHKIYYVKVYYIITYNIYYYDSNSNILFYSELGVGPLDESGDASQILKSMSWGWSLDASFSAGESDEDQVLPSVKFQVELASKPPSQPSTPKTPSMISAQTDCICFKLKSGRL